VKKEIILEMKNISKRFGGVHALDGVSLTLRRGEVHALVSENGAGKSALMKILIGLHQADEGGIVLNGKKVVFKSVREAQNAGISMIFQEFNQVKVMSVMENIYLGREPKTKLGSVDFKKMYRDSKTLLKELGVDLDPTVKIQNLTADKHQLVKIVKAISLDAGIIIMDGPTSALSKNEIECYRCPSFGGHQQWHGPFGRRGFLQTGGQGLNHHYHGVNWPYSVLFQPGGFNIAGLFCPKHLIGKEPVPKPRALAHSQLVLGQAHYFRD
jgi:ABC-type branched-subunit amino acid transport system ATPase component